MRKLRRLINKVDPRKKLFIDISDYRKTVFLAGTGRSGTTWLEDIINYTGSYRIMFEPFHSKKVDIVSHFNYRQYIRPNNREKKFIEPTETILSGKIKHSWIDKFNKKTIAEKRIIKDIRANFMLKWIKEIFPEIPIILLIRHPCAVACSKLNLGWDTHLEELLAQEELMEDFLNPFRDIIEFYYKINNCTFDKHILMWCAENYVPLRQFKEGGIHLVFYENLCINPAEESKKIFGHINENYFSQKVMNAIKKPSALSRKESAIYSKTSLVDSWRSQVTNKQIKTAVKILTLFGLHNIYSEDSMPQTRDYYNHQKCLQ